MENSNLFDLSIDAEASGHLSETARWAKFLAIIGFISCGFMIIFGLVLNFVPLSPGAFGAAQTSEVYNPGLGAGGTIGMILYLGIGIISIFPYIFLLQFSKRLKQALLSSDQGALVSAFAAQKSLYKFVGVLTIIMLCFVVLSFIIGIVAGAMYMTAGA